MRNQKRVHADLSLFVSAQVSGITVLPDSLQMLSAKRLRKLKNISIGCDPLCQFVLRRACQQLSDDCWRNLELALLRDFQQLLPKLRNYVKAVIVIPGLDEDIRIRQVNHYVPATRLASRVSAKALRAGTPSMMDALLEVSARESMDRLASETNAGPNW